MATTDLVKMFDTEMMNRVNSARFPQELTPTDKKLLVLAASVWNWTRRNRLTLPRISGTDWRQNNETATRYQSCDGRIKENGKRLLFGGALW